MEMMALRGCGGGCFSYAAGELSLQSVSGKMQACVCEGLKGPQLGASQESKGQRVGRRMVGRVGPELTGACQPERDADASRAKADGRHGVGGVE